MDLDFSALSDDQLIALIRAACAEAVARGSATEAAAREAYMSADDRVQIARAAADREIERVRQEEMARVAREAEARIRGEVNAKRVSEAEEASRKLWAAKKGIALAVHALTDAAGYSPTKMQIHVWLSPSKEKRVYVGYGFDSNLFTLFVTGNAKQAPMSYRFERNDRDLKARKAEFIALCTAVAAAWNGIRVDIAEALAWSGEATPLPGYAPTPEPAKPVAAEAPAAPVTLPSTLRHRDGVEGIACNNCSSWAHDGERIVHAPSCSTKASVPDGYVRPQ